MKKLYLLLLMVVAAISSYGKIPVVRSFTPLDYKGGRQNWDIDIAKNHVVFFANDSGVLTFDGNRWHTIKSPNNSAIRSVMYDEDTGRIYVGAYNEVGYFEVLPPLYREEYRSIVSELGAADSKIGEVWHIAKGPGGRLLVGADKGFYVLRDGKPEAGFAVEDIKGLLVTDKAAYIGTSGEIFEYAYSGRTLSAVAANRDMNGTDIVALMEHGGDMIVATAKGGVFRRGADGSIARVPLAPGIDRARIYCAAMMGDRLALGTIGDGAIVVDITTGEAMYANVNTGLPNNTVLSVCFDGFGNLWLGLDNGISYMMVNSPFSILYDETNKIGTGYASIVDGGQLYLGTNQGLYALSAPPHTPLYRDGIGRNLTKIRGIDGQVWNCQRFPGHSMLVSHNDGVDVVDGFNATPVHGVKGTWGFTPLQGTDCLLGCDYDGLFILEPAAPGHYRVKNRVEGGDVVSGLFMQDQDGSIWMAHWQEGVYRMVLSPDLTRVVHKELYDEKNGLVTTRDNLICKIDSQVYVSSVDGFRRLVGNKLEMQVGLNGVFNTFGLALRVTQLPTGHLLAYKPGYLAIGYKQPDGSFRARQLPYNHLERRLQMAFGNVGVLDSADVLLNYDNGFFVLDTREGSDSDTLSKVMIRSITGTAANDTLLYAATHLSEGRVTIPYSLNSIRFSFVYPEYRDHEAVEYSCYLEGYDKEWINPSVLTEKEYTGLRPGLYTFHVRAIDKINDASSETSIEVRVLSPWYMKWWAVCLYVLLGIAVLGLVGWFVRRSIILRTERIRQEETLKRREQQIQFNVELEKKQNEIIRQEKQQLEKILKQKAGQLADSAMNVARKNDILAAIDSQLEQMHLQVKNNAAKSVINNCIAGMRRDIRANMVDDANWNKFEENFNLVYDNFTQKLLARYPDLKKLDIKLCVYLRIGMNTKEMASLLNMGVHSLETARYRLRKKLGIESGDNLFDFIQSIDRSDPAPAQ